jgi:hypothetical protein
MHTALVMQHAGVKSKHEFMCQPIYIQATYKIHAYIYYQKIDTNPHTHTHTHTKQPTVTPTEVQRIKLGLKKAWGSPNGAMRRSACTPRELVHLLGCLRGACVYITMLICRLLQAPLRMHVCGSYNDTVCTRAHVRSVCMS